MTTHTDPALFTPLHAQPVQVPLAALSGYTAPDSATTRSVTALGFISAILITPDTSAPDGEERYTILDGKRRAHDAHAAGLTHIPALIVEGDPATLAATTLATNLCRRPNVADEARALRNLIAAAPYADDALKPIARELGLSVHALRATARLLDLPADLFAHVGGRISAAVARDLVSLPEPARTAAYTAAREKLDSADTARFTATDLKAARTAKTDALADLAAAALSPFSNPAPLAFAAPAALLAQTVRAQANAQGVPLSDLLAELNAAADAGAQQ